MSGMEFNKLFAAALVAGASAMLCGFVAKQIVHVEKPHENAFKIEVSETEAGGAPVAEAVAEPVLALLATADVAKGQGISKVCAACHSFGKGEPARVGPNLWGIVGNKHAHMEGFSYSDGMKAMHDKAWTLSELNVFLWNPKKHVAGTKMTYAGMKKPQDRADLIAWLRTQADSPAPLPTPAEITAEAPKPADAAPAADGKPVDGKDVKGAESKNDPAHATPEAAKEAAKDKAEEKADAKKEDAAKAKK